AESKKICFYCDIPEIELINYPEFSNLHKKNQQRIRLTIDRVNNSLPYEIGNLVLACALCNRIKNNFFTEIEMREISQKYIKPKWQK
ncbi:MAG TPA: hypothetical protein VIY47_15495, partial [Ignavibacteriaceae bacterium]